MIDKDSSVSNKWSNALLQYAHKEKLPYAAVILYNKRDVIIRQIEQLDELFPKHRTTEVKLKQKALYSMARELERADELLTLEL